VKEIIILGDIELGCGDLHDDFISDKLLSKLILSLSRKKHPVDLVFNGDTFDFLKAPHYVKNKPTFPKEITPEISIAKLKRMFKVHKKVINALKVFLKKKRHQVVFIFGNHDPDLHFKEIQKFLQRNLKGNITFTVRYTNGPVHAEHGHEFDPLNKLKKLPPIKIKKGKKILNLPWVSIGAIRMQDLKVEHPFLERIKPIPLMLKSHPTFAKKMRLKSFWHGFVAFMASPIHIIRISSYEVFTETFSRLINANFEISKIFENFKNFILMKKPETTIHVLGHVHDFSISKKRHRVFIHSDTWRDEYILFENKLYSKPKHYVQILLKNKKARWDLVTIHPKRKVLDFNKVIQNEVAWINKVRKEEHLSTKK